MTRKPISDDVLTQIRSCLDAATTRPGLVRACMHQTEGYLRGLQGMVWEAPALSRSSDENDASLFLNSVRKGELALRGRIKKTSAASMENFLLGFFETFPDAKDKSFTASLSRLWTRWNEGRTTDALEVGKGVGLLLKAEYEEGVAGDLSVYLLDDRLHLRPVRDYLRMRGWLQGTIEFFRRKPDWESRERARTLAGNFSSIILRALHNANIDYAALAVAKLPHMTSQLDQAIANLSGSEPEASHFLRKNRSTILTRALHSGYFDYPKEAVQDLPGTLRKLNERIVKLESESPEAARELRASVDALVYRALTNGKLSAE